LPSENPIPKCSNTPPSVNPDDTSQAAIDRHDRLARTPGATDFLTVATYHRQHLFKHPETVQLLRQSFLQSSSNPFDIEAMAKGRSKTIWRSTHIPHPDAQTASLWGCKPPGNCRFKKYGYAWILL
jgi:hypothetical protein